MNKKILKILKKCDKIKQDMWISREDLKNKLSENNDKLIDRDVRELTERGFVELKKGIGAYFHDIRITKRGRDFLTIPIKKRVKKSSEKISPWYNNLEYKKAIKWIISILIVANIIYFIVIPISNQPTITISKMYDQNRKFFPDEIVFQPDFETNSYIATLNFYFTKIGGNPAIFYLTILNASGMLSKPYDGIELKEKSEDSKWFPNEKRGALRIVLQENPELEEFTLHIKCGMRYPIYPIFGIQSLPWYLGPTHNEWCEYEKVDDHEYQWKKSSLVT